MKVRSASLLCLLAIFCCMASAFAAEFSPELEAGLRAAGDKEFVSAIVILESPIDIRTLDLRLHDEGADLARRHSEVINALQYNAQMTQPKFKAEFGDAITSGDMEGFTAYWIENLFVISATKQYIESFRARGDIKQVCENFIPELIEPLITPHKPGYQWEAERGLRNPLDTMTLPPGIRAVGAYRVNTELGITGNGVLVANCDTGVDGTHPALSSRWRGNHAPWYHCWMDNLGTNTTTPNDGNAHGTHVMGTITGRAIVGSDTQWVGCAPAAEWIANNAINQGVSSNFDNDIIQTYQWYADPDSNVNTLDDVPDVIQNSWGVFTGLGYAQCFAFWNTVIQNCEAAGPVITWSAGNESTSGLRSPAIYSLNNYQIFAVAAVDASAYPTTPYPLASFSSQGPTPCTPAVPDNIKPEISAPGVNVYSSVPGGGYNGGYSGTSMAGPHVAGVVALMREACPNCDYITIKQAIMDNADDTGYGPAGNDNQFGYGFIRAYESVLAVSNLGRINGVVTNQSNGNPVSGARVRNTAGAQQVLTSGTGSYSLPLQNGTYSIEYSAFGYNTQTINGLVVTTGDTTIQNVALVPSPTGTVSGIVTDCFGSPAVGATVTILNTPVAPATTNGSGFYSITLPQGTYDIRATGAGCGSQTVTGVVIGVSTTQNFTLPSDPRFNCSTIDAGGYSACENGDASGPTYGWFEIAPAAGGPGTLTGVDTDDETLNFALPFTVRMYGTDYTSINICSNGFASFSIAASAFTNEALPSATIGTAVVPLWDDLLPGGSTQICTYHFAAQSAYIIEWYQIGYFSGSGGPETFQVWLYDVNAGGGPNGNSLVKYQYQTVGAGASATVGIGTSAIASQYQFGNTLDVSSQGLANSRIIQYGTSCAGAAEIDVTPLSISASAPVGSGDTVTVQICNQGTCPLFYNLTFTQLTPIMIPHYGYLPTLTMPSEDDRSYIAKGDEGRRGPDQLDNTGNDAFGYIWKDTAEPGGPAFNWVDIRSVGTNANLPQDDRALVVALPWSFRFYGSSYNQVSICTNGYLQFGASDTAWANRAIPTSTIPNGIIAAFWDDMTLDPADAGYGNIYYYNDLANNRFIVQWDSIKKFSGTPTGPFYFQAILEPCGDITIQHLTMNGVLTSASVGIENASGTVGSQVVFNAAYVTNNNAIKFTYPTVPWVSSVNPASGSVNGGQCASVQMIFSADACLPVGTYTGTLDIGNNDANENPVTVPVNFTVGQLDTPLNFTISYTRATSQLRFDWASTGAPFYRVYSATTPAGPFSTFVGQTATTNLSIVPPVGQRQFYVVVSTDGALLQSPPSLPARNGVE